MTNRLTSLARRAVRGGFAVALVAGAIAGLSGCGRWGGLYGHDAPVVPPPGWIFAQYKAPLDFELGNKGTGTPNENLSVGTAEAQYIQIFYRPLSFGFGKAGVDEAAKAGGLKTVHYADYELFNVLGLYQRVTVYAYGEK